ncbi:hypothetical protein GCM10007940_25090 [Portibacter lacus]|uniref:Uncharacterized protein n=2 Tax=Portibacter lacus TaxID=1099794 RepID=A0AA37WFN5_9BACT|nr:hypothetical protein GCM10007940_25090 [Portibacter lacus]
MSAFIVSLSSCLDFVDEGLETEYGDSDAVLVVESIGPENGAEGEVISFSISVDSDFDIKSCIIQTSNEGKNGSGFNVTDESFDDPFADHGFGTVRPGIQSFKVRYDYIIPEEINKSIISVLIVDESGKVEVEKTLRVVPQVQFHDDISLYAKDATFFDALSSSEGVVYPDIKTNSSTLSEENVAIQKKIDIVFYFNTGNKSAYITSLASGNLDTELSFENSALFKKISLEEGKLLSEITPSDLSSILESVNMVADGRGSISNVKVGDVILFQADVNAVNSLKAGILQVEGLHPASVPRYEGTSYVLECSVITQI